MKATIDTQLEQHLKNKTCCQIERAIGDTKIDGKRGFVLGVSDDFVLLQKIDDFCLHGFLIIPKAIIKHVRFNSVDKYYDKILRREKITEQAGCNNAIDLQSWETIFRSLAKLKLNIIVENEAPGDTSFDIGPILKTTKAAVTMRYFDAVGFLDTEPTRITWDKITLVKFDDRYANVLGKYLRERKPGKNNSQKS